MLLARLGSRRVSSILRPSPNRALHRPSLPLRTQRTTPLPSQQRRSASYQRFGQRGGSQQQSQQNQRPYSAFLPFARAQFIWRNYRNPILVVGGGSATFYAYNLERVPVTNRRRFNWVSPKLERELIDKQAYDEVQREYGRRFLPEGHQSVQLVRKVVQRLLATREKSGTAEEGEDWDVHVIDDPSNVNAFVTPGGKVFVFTGILPICQDENGLATVLSHEISHTLARHTAERVSRQVILLPLVLGTAYVFDISGQLSNTMVSLLLSLPNGRVQESEADHIGLLMMGEACYDPGEAVKFWERMTQYEKSRGGGAPPQFMSTHPSSYNRIGAIKGWMPQAMQKFNESNCAGTGGYLEQFRERMPGGRMGAGMPGGQRVQEVAAGDDDDFF